jgi:hypothetical protein
MCSILKIFCVEVLYSARKHLEEVHTQYLIEVYPTEEYTTEVSPTDVAGAWSPAVLRRGLGLTQFINFKTHLATSIFQVSNITQHTYLFFPLIKQWIPC